MWPFVPDKETSAQFGHQFRNLHIGLRQHVLRSEQPFTVEVFNLS